MTNNLYDWPGMAFRMTLDGRIVQEVSRAFAYCVNQTPEQLQGTVLDALLTPASRLYFIASIDPSARQGLESLQHTLYLSIPEGSFPFLVSVHPESDTSLLVLLMRADRHLALQQQLLQERDYTENLKRDLKKRERALLRQREQQKTLLEKLEGINFELLQTEKLAALGQLSAGIAHEINNPVGYIQSNLNSLGYYLERLLNLLAANQDDAFKQHLKEENFDFIANDLLALLNESQQGIEHITSIINALTQFTRAPGNLSYCDLHRQINITLRIVQNEVKSKAQVVRHFYEGPLFVACDPAQLNQVMMNVLMNALQAIERFGQITITTRVEDNVARIEVSDNGAGMNEDTLSHALEPFFTTKPEGEGTGLGLALVYNIIRRHFGKLTLDSDVGRGTRVTIWLPLVQECIDENEQP